MATFLVGQWGPGTKKVRLWPEMRQMLGSLWERNKHWWYPEAMLTQLADHYRWALQKVLGDPSVECDWNTMLAAVYHRAYPHDSLPSPDVSKAAMKVFLTGWVAFMNKNHLQRMGISTKKYGATGFMAGLNQKKKADEEDKGAKGSGGGRSWRGRGGGGGGGGDGADEGARGALTLTFVTTRTATQWFGLDGWTKTTMWALGVLTARRTLMAVTATLRGRGQVTPPGTGAVVMAVARGHVGPLAPPPHAAKGAPTWLHPVWGRVHHRRRPVLLPTPGVYSTP